MIMAAVSGEAAAAAAAMWRAVVRWQEAMGRPDKCVWDD